MAEKLKIDESLLEETILEVDEIIRALGVQLTIEEKARLAATAYRERTGHKTIGADHE